jgi:hypothetical protein
MFSLFFMHRIGTWRVIPKKRGDLNSYVQRTNGGSGLAGEILLPT